MRAPASLSVANNYRRSGQPYTATLRLQQELAGALKSTGASSPTRPCDTLLMVEHDPPVYTIGRQDTEEDFLIPPDELRRRGCSIVKTGRGGAGVRPPSL